MNKENKKIVPDLDFFLEPLSNDELFERAHRLDPDRYPTWDAVRNDLRLESYDGFWGYARDLAAQQELIIRAGYKNYISYDWARRNLANTRAIFEEACEETRKEGIDNSNTAAGLVRFNSILVDPVTRIDPVTCKIFTGKLVDLDPVTRKIINKREPQVRESLAAQQKDSATTPSRHNAAERGIE